MLMVQAGVFVENLNFPATDVIVDQLIGSGGVGPYRTSSYQAGTGQAFTLTHATTLSAITLKKLNTKGWGSGTYELALWIGGYSTNGVPGTTNYIGTIDLSNQVFTDGLFYTINLDAPVALSAGTYAFEMQFTTEEAGNDFSIKRSNSSDGADKYTGGGLVYATATTTTAP